MPVRIRGRSATEWKRFSIWDSWKIVKMHKNGEKILETLCVDDGRCQDYTKDSLNV